MKLPQSFLKALNSPALGACLECEQCLPVLEQLKLAGSCQGAAPAGMVPQGPLRTAVRPVRTLLEGLSSCQMSLSHA